MQVFGPGWMSVLNMSFSLSEQRSIYSRRKAAGHVTQTFVTGESDLINIVSTRIQSVNESRPQLAGVP